MSKFGEFYQGILTNDSIKREVADILGDTSLVRISKEQAERLVPIAGKMGYSITADEVIEYLYSGEELLDDDDLSAVAGGKGEDLHIYYDKDGNEVRREYR